MKVGDIVPDFTLPDQSGNEFNLYKNLHRNIMLIFYPKDNTPVCSNQLRNYQMNLDKFLSLNVYPVAINTAAIETHKNFCEAIGTTFPVLSDSDKNVSKLFGAINFLGTNKRIIYLIGRDKKVRLISKMLPINFIEAEKLIDELKILQLN